MTWPTTPIPTTNLDAGSDSPAAARADIKTMADQVNSIAAEFGAVDLTSTAPVTGDVLTYDGSKWAPAAPSAGGGGGAPHIWSLGTATSYSNLSFNNTYNLLDYGTATDVYDNGDGVVIASGQFSVPAGTWLFKLGGVSVRGATGSNPLDGTGIRVYDITDSVTLSPSSGYKFSTPTGNDSSFNYGIVADGAYVFTLTATHTVEIQIYAGEAANGIMVNRVPLEVTKLA